MPNEIDHLIVAYEALLRIYPDSKFRVDNQHVYASIRDAIADQIHNDPEYIQYTFENAASLKRLTDA